MHLTRVTITIREQTFPISFSIFPSILVNCFSHGSLDKQHPSILQWTRLYLYYFKKMQTHIYILLEVFNHSHRLIYKFTMQSNPCVYIQVNRRLAVCFCERYKILWPKVSIGLHAILNKSSSTVTDLELGLKTFGQ